MKAGSVLQMIGHTPLIQVGRLAENLKASILVKPEYVNPSGSLKDRIALKMIEDAEQKGLLRPGYTILESSTGNTGIALSFVGCLKGYKVLIYETTPGKIGEEKRKIMRGFGAEVRSLVPGELAKMKEKSVAGAEVESVFAACVFVYIIFWVWEFLGAFEGCVFYWCIGVFLYAFDTV